MILVIRMDISNIKWIAVFAWVMLFLGGCEDAPKSLRASMADADIAEVRFYSGDELITGLRFTAKTPDEVDDFINFISFVPAKYEGCNTDGVIEFYKAKSKFISVDFSLGDCDAVHISSGERNYSYQLSKSGKEALKSYKQTKDQIHFGDL